MKRWKALALTCIAALCCSAVLAGCSSQAYMPTPKNQTISNSALSSAGTLRVGVNASAAPLAGQTSSSSEIVGIDVDVAAAIADGSLDQFVAEANELSTGDIFEGLLEDQAG